MIRPCERQQTSGTFDLGRREAHSVTWLQHLIGCGGLAVDAYQIIGGPALRHPFRKQCLDRRAFRNLNVVGEPATVVIDLCRVHDYAESELLCVSFALRLAARTPHNHKSSRN